MTKPRPFLHAFGPEPLGGGVRRALGQVKRLEAFEDLYALFGHLFEPEWLAPVKAGFVRCRRLDDGTAGLWAVKECGGTATSDPTGGKGWR